MGTERKVTYSKCFLYVGNTIPEKICNFFFQIMKFYEKVTCVIHAHILFYQTLSYLYLIGLQVTNCICVSKNCKR